MADKRKLIIDCDPGIDDALALMLASKASNLEILGLTSVFGNNDCTHTTSNLLTLCSYFGIDAPVYKGADKPMIQPLHDFVEFHGKNGLGNVEFERPDTAPEKEHAWDAIYRLAKEHPKEITLVTLGPVTNVAIALLKYEDLGEYIKEIVMMGGSTDIGNEGPFSEANVYHDPHAAHVVFESGIPITMVGLNATEKTRMTIDELKDIQAVIPDSLSEIRGMIDHYLKTQVKYGDTGLVIHDLAAMVVVVDRSFATTKLQSVEVELNHPLMLGRTVIDLRPYAPKEKQVDVVYDIDKTKTMKMLKSTFASF